MTSLKLSRWRHRHVMLLFMAIVAVFAVIRFTNGWNDAPEEAAAAGGQPPEPTVAIRSLVGMAVADVTPTVSADDAHTVSAGITPTSQLNLEPLPTPPPTITTTTTAAPETTTQKPVPHWQPIDRAVIVYADVVDDAARFLRELGGGAAAKYVLVFSDDRILSSALHRLSSDRIAATLVLVADCGERLTVQRVVDIVDNDWLPQEMPVSSCEKSPRPSVGVARWLSISSGSFLFDAVRVLLFFGFQQGNDDTSLLLDLHASLVVVNPSEVHVCTRRQFGKFFIYFFLKMFHSTTREITMVSMPTAVSDSILKTVRQQPTLEHLSHQKRISSVPFQQLIRSSNSSIFVTPSVFGGSRESIRALIAALDEFQTRYPIPPGVEMDFVLATVLNEVREGRSSVQLKVRLVSDDDARVVTNDTCNVMEQCVLGDTTGSSLVSSLPALVLSSRRCMWSKPLQPAPLRQPPTCHSKWFDDYYLLHEGSSNTNRIPSALVSPNSLGAAWTAMGARDGRKQHATAAPQPPTEEPHLRLCVGKGRSAVLGMCTGYSPQMVATFVNTFAKFHRRSCTQLYLFVDEGQRGAYNATYGGEPDVVIVGIDALRSTLKLQSCGAVQWRKELFYEWLLLKERSEADANWLRYVMVVDTRDAHFQADPFEPLQEIVPEVHRRLERVQRTAMPAVDAGVLYLVPESLATGSMHSMDSARFEAQRHQVSHSCGLDAYYWSLNRALMPLLPIEAEHAEQYDIAVTPLASFGHITSSLYFGDYGAMKSALKLMVDSMFACEITTPVPTEAPTTEAPATTTTEAPTTTTTEAPTTTITTTTTTTTTEAPTTTTTTTTTTVSPATTTSTAAPTTTAEPSQTQAASSTETPPTPSDSSASLVHHAVATSETVQAEVSTGTGAEAPSDSPSTPPAVAAATVLPEPVQAPSPTSALEVPGTSLPTEAGTPPVEVALSSTSVEAGTPTASASNVLDAKPVVAATPVDIIRIEAQDAAPSATRHLLALEATNDATEAVEVSHEIPSACGTSNDQGMLHCLGMGGFDNVRFPHDVVMLNPDTHPYTHMFRFPSDIQFYEPGAPQASADRFGNALAYPCSQSLRSQIQRDKASRLKDNKHTATKGKKERIRRRPYSVILQAKLAPEFHTYVNETLSKLT